MVIRLAANIVPISLFVQNSKIFPANILEIDMLSLFLGLGIALLIYGFYFLLVKKKTNRIKTRPKVQTDKFESKYLESLEEIKLINRSKRDFVSNMSHEIRTPLNGVIGITDLMLETTLTVEQKNYVKMVKHSADQLLSITNDILDLSKIETGQLDLDSVFFNVHKVVEDAADMMVFLLDKKNINLHIYIANNLPESLRGDPKRLRQILVNLISNAYKFTEKGEITIIVQAEELTQNNVTLKFSVSDSGTGIEQEKIESIFKSFNQADTSATRKFGGSGLGLSISQQICELMNGNIWVESPAKIIFPNTQGPFDILNGKDGRGPGSTFHFTAKFVVHNESLKNKQEVKNPPSGLTVLCLDVHPINGIVITQMMDKYDYKVNSLSGEVKLQEELKKNNYDVVFIDHQYPNLNLKLVIETLRNESNIPIIILTTLSEEKDLSVFKSKENIWSITKPIKKDILVNILINMLSPAKGIIFKKADSVSKEVDRLYKLKDNATILLVEDNRINQRVALALLAKSEIPVDVADDGVIAIKMLKEKRYDLVLMDIAMPNMDGITATKNIRKELGLDIPVIALTAQAIGDSDECFAAGMNDYIAKPIDPKILYKTLVKWLMAELKLKKVITKV